MAMTCTLSEVSIAATLLLLLVAKATSSVNVKIESPLGPLPSTFLIPKAHRLFFICQVTGAPGNSFTIVWHRNDDPLISGKGVHVAGPNMEVLHVTQASRGVYVCCADAVPEQVCSPGITVVVLDPPILRPSWGRKRIIYVRRGTIGFKLSVNVTYSRLTHCDWSKDGIVIKDMPGRDYNCKFHENPLIELELPIRWSIDDSPMIDYDDSGRYSMNVRPSYFVDSSVSVTVVVVGPPVAPAAPTVSVLGYSSLSVLVNVNRSMHGNRSIGRGTNAYLLQYALVGSTEWVTINVSATSHRQEMSITQLRPCSRYNVRMLACNKYGVSLPSPTVTVTLPPVPYDKFQLYPDQTNDRFVTFSQNLQMAVCLPPHLRSTKVGDFICHLPEYSNPNNHTVSTLSSLVIRVTLTCSKEDEPGDCTLMCPVPVDECPERHATLSKQKICSTYKKPVHLNGTGGISEPPTVNSHHATGVDVNLAGLVAGVIIFLVVLILTILVICYRKGLISFNVCHPCADLQMSLSSVTAGEDGQLHAVESKPERSNFQELDKSDYRDNFVSESSDGLHDTHGEGHSKDKLLDTCHNSNKRPRALSLSSRVQYDLEHRGQLISASETPSIHSLSECNNTNFYKQGVVDSQKIVGMQRTELPQLPAKRLGNFLTVDQLEHCTSANTRQRFQRSYSANDAGKCVERVKQPSAESDIPVILKGLNQKVDMLHGTVGELLIETSQNSATLRQVTEQQEQGKESLQFIESYSAKTHSILADVDRVK